MGFHEDHMMTGGDSERMEGRVMRPKFPVGLIVSTETLVIDENGVGWWIFPKTMTIVPATNHRNYPASVDG